LISDLFLLALGGAAGSGCLGFRHLLGWMRAARRGRLFVAVF